VGGGSRFPRVWAMSGALVLVALAALIVTLSSQSGRPGATPGEPPALNHLLGVHEGPDWAAGVSAFASALGRQPSVVLSYEDSSSWQMIAHPDWALERYYGGSYRVVLSVPMLPDDPSTTLQAGAAGAYDSYFAELGQTLMAHRAVHAILRIGWEMNSSYYRWSWGADARGGNPSYSDQNTAVQNAADYRSYFRRIVTVLRATPGQAFVIDWGPSLGSAPGGAPVEAGYPGDDVVDLIGEDVYDAVWQQPMSPEARWDRMVSEAGGLTWQAQFAQRHGKAISFPEWGLANTAWLNGGGGGDDGYFVDQLTHWMSTHNVGYQSYYDVDNPAGNEQHRLADFPAAQARYRAAFG
jgi:hypothetical protein